MKKYVFSEVRGKEQGKTIIVESENVTDAISQLDIDEVILPHQKFKKMYFNSIFAVHEQDKPWNTERIVHFVGYKYKSTTVE